MEINFRQMILLKVSKCEVKGDEEVEREEVGLLIAVGRLIQTH